MRLFAFLFSTFVFFLQMIPSIHLPLQPYMPWLVLMSLQERTMYHLFAVAITGCCIDLFSDHPFGVFPISYVATTLFIARYRLHFLVERPLHLSLCTGIASLIASFCQLFLLFLLSDQQMHWGFAVIGDLIGRGVLDGLYAFVFTPLVAFPTAWRGIRSMRYFFRR